jgi:hypothetical protein
MAGHWPIHWCRRNCVHDYNGNITKGDIVEHEKPAPEAEKPTRKIALLGSAISSVGLAPFHEPDWEIWACSPANKPIPRADLWFELHNIEVKKREGLSEYLEWLSKRPFKCFMQAALPEFPNSIAYPLKEMTERYGPFWWTSQLSYMLALAIEQKPAAIGLFGIDMAANSEYNQQRLACQFFIRELLNKGINLVVPPESDILEPAPLYGYCESSRQWRKYYARQNELKQRVDNLNAEIQAKSMEKTHLVGAMDDMEYHLSHWANRRDFY